ncbi:ead/Ea22-like family protein [Salmonella enterica]|nr:ead/Ea22-like family protein [Salmonella enterica]EIT6212838.1 ead/Ea22-like family protein [Salmonella enterica]
MSEINYQALREAAQNYQSTLAWYEAIADNPNAEQDCNEAVAAFKRQIRHQEMDIIAELLEELETKDNRIAELEKITTDHALKFQKAQDALKYAALLHSRTAQQTNNFAVSLPDISEYFINDVFQPLRYERDVERAIIKAGGKALWQEKHEDRTHQSCDVNCGWFSPLTTDKNNT